MLRSLVGKIFGSRNERYLASLNGSLQKINSLEAEFEKLSDENLSQKTIEFKEQLKKGKTLDDILPQAFATVREVAKRKLGQRHYDVQLIGGMVLHNGKISEMKTGEGKTLVSTLPAYLNALSGKGVHIVTVNDYLAQRDAKWMSTIFNFLGLSVGCVVNDLEPEERKEAYARKKAKRKWTSDKGSASGSTSPTLETIADCMCKSWRMAGKCPRLGSGKDCPHEHPPVETAAVAGTQVPSSCVAMICAT
jgi:hypothetical protein